MIVAHNLWLVKVIKRFQENIWPRFINRYRKVLGYALERPWKMLLGTVGLFFLTIALLIVRSPGTSFFPSADPNFIYVYLTLPVGTDQAYTDSVTKVLEGKVERIIGKDNPIVRM
jgi:multidrug efflux pump